MICVLDLFSGIGGISLGLESVGGFTTVAFCEIDPFCREVLKKHWPAVPVFEDVTKLTAADVGPVDMIAGGFPCQDISCAGKGAGLGTDDSPSGRSGLWFEMLRLVRECRPAWVLTENVPALYSRGYDLVAAGLEAAGYSVRPLVVGAWAVGAPHKRDRVWIVAHDDRQRGGASGAEAVGGRGQEELAHLSSERDSQSKQGISESDQRLSWGQEGSGYALRCGQYPVADPEIGQGDGRDGRGVDGSAGGRGSVNPSADAGGQDGLLADSNRAGSLRGPQTELADGGVRPLAAAVAVAQGPGLEGAEPTGTAPAGRCAAEHGLPCRWPSRPGEPQHEWEPPRTVEPRLGGDVDGISDDLESLAIGENDVDEGELITNLQKASVEIIEGARSYSRVNALKAYGNSVVPQVVDAIGKAILDHSVTDCHALEEGT